jgi:hypothetical protein
MLITCPNCKSEAHVEIAVRSLVSCPSCEFLFAMSPGQPPQVPTFSEEDELPRYLAARPVHTTAALATDVTLIAEMTEPFGNLEFLPRGKVLYVEVEESPALAHGTMIRMTKGRVVFGRTDADVAIEDDRISRKHAVIDAISRENIYLRDLASTNGTYLNGQRVTTSKLRDGDQIRIGNSTLRFHIEDQ